MLKKFLHVAVMVVLIVLLGATVATAQDGEETEEPSDTDAAPSGTPAEICEQAQPPEEPETREYDAPQQVLDPSVDYRAVICTEYGPVYVDLFEGLTPETVNNFVFLAQNDFYDNLTFHRVIADFMVQGGDPQGDGTGGPGYQFEDEFVSFLTFDRPGLLAMANSGADTNGSQFFITTVVTDWLNFNHTIFGEVLAGQDNAEAIPPTESNPAAALNEVVIIEDPSRVETDYSPSERVSRETLASKLDEIPALNTLEQNDDLTGDFDTADYVDMLPEDVQETASTFFDDYNHQYTATVTHEKPDCDFEAVPIQALTFDIHVFETTEDARAASQDDDTLGTLLAEGNEAEDVTLDFSGLPGERWTAETDCDGEMTAARVVRHVGHFLVTTKAVYPADSDFNVQFLDGVNVEVYENTFREELRREASQ